MMENLPAQPLRILLVEDHEMIRVGLRILVEQRPGFLVCGEAANGSEALRLSASEQPDIVLLDLALGSEDGLDIITDLRAAAPLSRILVLTGLTSPTVHQRAARLGALGLVQKAQTPSALLAAITAVARGEAFFDPRLVASLISDMARVGTSADPTVLVDALTPRERAVVGLVCEGLPNKRIALRLSISETTVRHHLTSIFDKLAVESRLELVIYAYRHGLVPLPDVQR